MGGGSAGGDGVIFGSCARPKTSASSLPASSCLVDIGEISANHVTLGTERGESLTIFIAPSILIIKPYLLVLVKLDFCHL